MAEEIVRQIRLIFLLLITGMQLLYVDGNFLADYEVHKRVIHTVGKGRNRPFKWYHALTNTRK